ncbi:MAG: hypothetical protein JJT82_06750 [Legionellaceae bacterium]|nr:hypothetical protein [Legionellaceae bacterium]
MRRSLSVAVVRMAVYIAAARIRDDGPPGWMTNDRTAMGVSMHIVVSRKSRFNDAGWAMMSVVVDIAVG